MSFKLNSLPSIITVRCVPHLLNLHAMEPFLGSNSEPATQRHSSPLTNGLEQSPLPVTNGLTKRIRSILKVSGTNRVDGDGRKVVLKGAGLGGHLNMENFITGFSGHESEHRAAMFSVLGPEKYKYFFDKFLDYFFTSSDAKFFASLGVN